MSVMLFLHKERKRMGLNDWVERRGVPESGSHIWHFVFISVGSQFNVNSVQFLFL